MKINLSGLLPEEIVSEADLKQSYRGRQIFKWIHAGTETFDEMTNLSAHLREELTAKASVYSSEISTESAGSDGTVKITVKLYDGYFIEAVLLEDETGRKTACLSSQAGCAMGCKFCRTGTMGLKRNLTAGEIVEQFLLLQNKYGRISNIVFMGMGEPFENIDKLRKSLEIFHHKDGQNIGLRKITVSTCGIIDGINSFTEEGPAVRLAVSLVSADQETRSRIMPITKSNPLTDLKKSLKRYQEATKKRFTLEYVLLGGINDSIKDAEKVRHFIGNMKAAVNVIPWNPAEGLPFEEPSEETTASFINRLEELGVTVTRRYKRGRGINGACGQLAVFENCSDSSDPG